MRLSLETLLLDVAPIGDISIIIAYLHMKKNAIYVGNIKFFRYIFPYYARERLFEIPETNPKYYAILKIVHTKIVLASIAHNTI